MKKRLNRRKLKKKYGSDKYVPFIEVLSQFLSEKDKILTKFDVLTGKHINGFPVVAIEYSEEYESSVKLDEHL